MSRSQAGMVVRRFGAASIRRRAWLTPGACLLLMLSAAGLSGGCSRAPDAGGASSKKLAPPDYVHFVRGRIVQLPEEGKPVNSLQIHHEPIEAWVRPDGTLGMNAMIMPFKPAPSLDLKPFAVGDIVEFRWEVRQRGNGPSLVTQLTRLPPETVLNLGKTGGG